MLILYVYYMCMWCTYTYLEVKHSHGGLKPQKAFVLL